MKKHIHYFDYLRVFAAISVVYMHVAATPLRGEINTDWQIINILTSLAFTAVPLFFMMSGYLVLSDEKTLDVRILLKKRLPHLIVPLFAYTVIAVLWTLYSTNELSIRAILNGLISTFYKPAWVHFWYMYTLIALYIISPILAAALKTLDKNGHKFIFILTIILVANSTVHVFFPNVNIDILNKLTLFGGHLSTFILGYYLGNCKKKIPNIILFAIFFVTLTVITIGTANISAHEGVYNQNFQSQSSGFEILLAASIFMIAKQLCDFEFKILKYIPIVPLSLAIYLIHNLLLSILKHYEYIKEITSFGDTVIISVVIFILSYLIAKIFATIKPLCFPLTGLKFDSACNSCNFIYTFKKR